MVDRPRREHEAVGDLTVLQPGGDQLQDLELTRREVAGILSRRRARAAGQAAHPTLTEPAGDDRGRRCRPEPLELVEGTAHLVVVLGVGPGERSVVRATERGPLVARPPRNAALDAGPPPPSPQL